MSKGGKRPGAGRPKGAPNKLSLTMKDEILKSFENQGGHKYLDRVAKSNPQVYLAFISKIIPSEIKADIDANIDHSVTFKLDYKNPEKE